MHLHVSTDNLNHNPSSCHQDTTWERIIPIIMKTHCLLKKHSKSCHGQTSAVHGHVTEQPYKANDNMFLTTLWCEDMICSEYQIVSLIQSLPNGCKWFWFLWIFVMRSRRCLERDRSRIIPHRVHNPTWRCRSSTASNIDSHFPSSSVTT